MFKKSNGKKSSFGPNGSPVNGKEMPVEKGIKGEVFGGAGKGMKPDTFGDGSFGKTPQVDIKSKDFSGNKDSR